MASRYVIGLKLVTCLRPLGLKAFVALNNPAPGESSGILWIEELENDSGDDPGAEVSHEINPDVRPCREAHDRNAHRDCRVEGCAGNTADGEGARHDREP